MAKCNKSSILQPNLLLVEGNDEVNFLIPMLEFLQIETVQVHSIDGINNLRSQLKVIPKIPGYSLVKRVAVLVDNDLDPVARHQSIRDSLAAANFHVPSTPDELSGSPLQVMYSMLPGPTQPGCLEDLLMQSFVDDMRTPHVNQFLTRIGLAANPISSRWPKSWVHSVLSTHEEPGKKIGEATRAGYINVKHAAFEPVHNFLKRLAS